MMYTLFLPFRDLRSDVETAVFPGGIRHNSRVDTYRHVAGNCGASMSFGFRLTLACDVRAGFSVQIPAGFRVACWHELATASRANSPASSRPRRVRGQKGGTRPGVGGGRANIHGVVHAHDTLFFVEQSATTALNYYFFW